MAIQKKEFNYRGKKMEELMQLELGEFAKLLKSRERRTILRQSDELQRFLLKCKKKTEKNKQIKTHARHLIIVPQLVGKTIRVYNGKEFVPIQIVQEMLGSRIGEYAHTRTKVKHGAAGVGATRSSASLSMK